MQSDLSRLSLPSFSARTVTRAWPPALSRMCMKCCNSPTWLMNSSASGATEIESPLVRTPPPPRSSLETQLFPSFLPASSIRPSVRPSVRPMRPPLRLSLFPRRRILRAPAHPPKIHPKADVFHHLVVGQFGSAPHKSRLPCRSLTILCGAPVAIFGVGDPELGNPLCLCPLPL